MPKIIAFVTYETPQFPCGGIAAVLGKLPSAMKELSPSHSIVIAPRHVSANDNNKIQTSPLTKVGGGTCRYRDAKIQCSAWRLDAAVPTYFVGPDSAPAGEATAFGGERHPYDLDAPTLLRDALLFGAIVAELLPVIGTDVIRTSAVRSKEPPPIDWRLVMQDWEAATVALAMAQTPLRTSLYLVLHNSYDCFAPMKDTEKGGIVQPGLERIGLRMISQPDQTILQRVLPLVRQPVFTVSAQFAHEFTDDLLQTEVLAPHLQKFFSDHPLFGVDNGPFTKFQVPTEVLRDTSNGSLTELQRWKASKRIKALEALANHQPTAESPVWGDREKFRKGAQPWFVMAGRDDPRQKGYDVAALAVEQYLARHEGTEDCPQFVFFPIPGDEGKKGLQFLEGLADEHSESVLVLPFRWAEGYMATLQASSYGLMPSLYEPFGMANEFYLGGGCVGIGRATGGNVQQLVPLWATRSCNAAVRGRSARFHSMSSTPTGLLFREADDLPDASGDWRGINAAKYTVGSSKSGRVQERSKYEVFRLMAAELRWAMEDGIRILEQEPALYARMLAAGIHHITQTFSWFRAAQEYARYVDS